MSYPPDNLNWDRLKADVRRATDGVELYPRLHPNPAGDIRDGGTVRCIAPNHEDRDPSMSLHADGFKCHACGVSGDVFDMWALVYGHSTKGNGFKRTLVELADDYCNFTLENYARNGESIDVDPQGTWSPPEPGEGWKHAWMRESGINSNSAGGERSPNAAPDPLETRRILFARLWKVWRRFALPLEDHHRSLLGPLSRRVGERAAEWLCSRNIEPHVAGAYGCADLETRPEPRFENFRDVIRAFGERHGAQHLHAAGMINDKGEAWWPLRTYLEDDLTPDPGLCIPVWHPDHPDTPIAMRWRFYEPGDDFPPKCMGQPSGPGRFQQPPLGLCEPPPSVQLEINETWVNALPHEQADAIEPDGRWRPVGAYPGPYAVVLCEGETDWLSVAAAALELHTETRIVPIGLTTMSAPWRDEWADLIEGADRIVVAFDRGTGDNPNGEQRTREILRGLTRRHGERYIRERVTVELRDDDEDLNDLRAAGALAGRLRRWLHLEDV